VKNRNAYIVLGVIVVVVVAFLVLRPQPTPDAPVADVPATEAPAVDVATDAPPPPPEKHLVVSAQSEYAETFDISIMPTAYMATQMLYDSLVSVDPNGEYKPGGLTERFEVSADGTVTTFYLKEGITFHDGSDFTADVVKWNIELVQNGAGCCAYLFTPVIDINVIDDYTIALTTDGPFPGLIFNLSSAWGLMMSQAKYEECGEAYGLSPECISGTGPFKLTEWVANDHVVLERYDDYNWAASWTGHTGPANVDSITIKFIAEDATRLVDLEVGDTHLMTTAPWRDITTFQDDPAFQVVQIPEATLYYILMPIDQPMVADINTRHAIGHSIDRTLIQDALYMGLGAAKTTYLASEITADKGVVGLDYDPAKAADLFAAAGWVMGDDGVLVAESVEGVDAGTRFEVSFSTYQHDEGQRMAEATQKMLADVGIVGNIEVMDDATYIDAVTANEVQLGVRVYTWDNADILPWFIHSQYLPYPNYTNVNDPWLDECMDDADYNSESWAVRDEKYVVCQQYIIDDLYPWAPIFQRPTLWFARDTVEGIVSIPLRGEMSTELWVVIDLAE
jgi:peptide/nickel transport system substrate-binding protein